jgi:hypothetical protein
MLLRAAARAVPSAARGGAAPRRTLASSCRRPGARAAACHPHRQPRVSSSSSSRSSRRCSRSVAARAQDPSGGDGEGEGEVYEVVESSDDIWATVALPVAMSSSEGQQVEYLVLDTDGALAAPAVESYLQQLQRERDAEEAMLQGARGDAAAAGGGDAGGGDWAMDPTLLKRMAIVRDAERGLIVQVRACGA